MSLRSFADAVASLQRETEKADAARKDPAIQASMAAEYADRTVPVPPELQRRSRERDWSARGIPARLWPMLHDGAPDSPAVGPLAPKPRPALEAVRLFLLPEETKSGLVLAGPVNTGKTVAASWGAAWGGGRVVKALDLVRAGLYPDDHGFWPRLQGEKLLVIDDLGTEPLDAKGYGFTAICDLVDRRYDAARKTIITTNLPLEAFRERYGGEAGARLWRRLVEVYRFVELTGGA